MAKVQPQTLAVLALLGGGVALLAFSRRTGVSTTRPTSKESGQGYQIPPLGESMNILGEGDIPSHDYAGIPQGLGVNLEPEELE